MNKAKEGDKLNVGSSDAVVTIVWKKLELMPLPKILGWAISTVGTIDGKGEGESISLSVISTELISSFFRKPAVSYSFSRCFFLFRSLSFCSCLSILFFVKKNK